MLSFEERAAEWQRRFDDQRSSGLTVTAWCRERGIEKNTFYGWRKRLTQTSSPMASAPQFIAVSVEPQQPASASLTRSEGASPDCRPLTLRIGRVAVEVTPGFNPALLREVIDALEPCAC